MFMKSALIILGVVLMSFTSKDNENKKFGVNCTITHGRYHTVDGVRSLLWSRMESCDGKHVYKYYFGTGPIGPITNGDLSMPVEDGIIGKQQTEDFYEDDTDSFVPLNILGN